MPVIDLNADLAEHDVLTADDVSLLDVVTSASLACGFHAGSARVMRDAAEACVARGVAIGAHVSYRDRAGFGRRVLEVAPDRLAADVVEQWEALVAEAAAAGGTVAYVKPHGALYTTMAADPEVAATVTAALAGRCRVLVAPPASALAGPAAAAGIRMVTEGFCDRGYDADGRLVPRTHAGALLDGPAAVGDRARSLAVDRGVHAVDGAWVALEVETLCVHGDRPGAGDRARAARDALHGSGVRVRSFVTADPS
ncbi:MAG TPA: 5-oxoprolinase subunit PxpA [Acidimicrobiales bacterium]|nr:5-oxoprolinase subunit PxpA [Acidimicrobiales bacterium]